VVTGSLQVPVPLAEVWMPAPVELFGKVVVLVAG
jgi:hypothetical protein